MIPCVSEMHDLPHHLVRSEKPTYKFDSDGMLWEVVQFHGVWFRSRMEWSILCADLERKTAPDTGPEFLNHWSD